MAMATQQRGKATGFSLIEILIAIGILGVCLPMAAALFATAVKENEGSYENSMGSIICDNGLAVVKMKVPYSSADLTTFAPITTLGNDATYPIATVWSASANYAVNTLVQGADGKYYVATQPSGPGNGGPNGPPNTSFWAQTAPKGFIAIRRALTAGDNDYQIIIVSHAMDDASHTCAWDQITGTMSLDIPTGYSRFTPTDGKTLQKGAFVVLETPATNIGNTAKVISRSDTDALFDRKLTVDASGTTPLTGSVKLQTITEIGGGKLSPALSLTSVRTSL